MTAAAPKPGELTAVPGSPGYGYRITGPGRGEVWKMGPGRSSPVLDWCPEVTRHLVQYGASAAGIVARKVTIRVGDLSATVPLAEVDDGTVWRTRLGCTPGRANREIREVLTNIVEHQAMDRGMDSMTPRWVGDRFVMPPEDIAPRGYGRVSGSREQWQDLLREIARSPRIALVVGLAIGGLYVRPLGKQSYMIHLPGGSSEGKTTAMIAAASQFGFADPEGVIQAWNVTKQGPGSWLRSMNCLTGFRDELGANRDFRQLEALIFGLLQGAERDMSGRDGDYRESRGSWRGCLVSSGNIAILSQITNEGIAARVLELRGDLTIDAEHSDRIMREAATVHGHGLAAVIEHGLTPAAFAELAAEQLRKIGAPAGGVTRRIAQHLSMGAAGAVMLADLAGVPEFAAKVTEAAAGMLADLTGELVERGASPGDRLLSAVRDHMASRPAEWPSRSEYERAVRDGGIMPREISGWNLSGDSWQGSVAVIPSRLREIADKADIADVRIALQDLRRRKPNPRLILQGDVKRLNSLLPIFRDRVRVHVLDLEGLDDDTETPPDASAEGAPAPQQDEAGERVDGALVDVDPAPPTALMLVTDSDLKPSEVEPREVDDEHRETDMPAEVDDRPSGALAVAADLDGLYLWDGTVVDPGEAYASMPAFLGAVCDLMGDVGTVAITADLAARLGYPGEPVAGVPASRKPRGKKQAGEPRAVAEATAAGWSSSEAGIGAWTSWWAGDRSVQVAVIDWQSRSHIVSQGELYLSSTDDPITAAYLLGRFRELTGAPYGPTAGTALTTMIRTTWSAANRKPGQVRVPKLKIPNTGKIRARETSIEWIRPMAEWTEEERKAAYVIGYDAWTAYLGALGASELAYDLIEHTGIEKGFQRNRAGYWLVGVPEWRPYPNLPDLLNRGPGEATGPVWRTTPSVSLLLDHGMPEDAITDAMLAPERPAPAAPGGAAPGVRGRGQTHTGRICRDIAERLQTGIWGIGEGSADREESRVREALKSVYGEGYGMLAHGTPWVRRPDWADTIAATARVGLMRKVIKVGTETGQWPVALITDCVYYATSTDDPETENPGLKLGTTLGTFRAKKDGIHTIEQWQEKKGE